MATKNVISFDTETFRFEPYNMAPRVVCLTWAENKSSGIVVGGDNITRWMRQHLEAAVAGRVVLVGHVVAYDMSCLAASFPSLSDLIWRAYEVDGVTCTAIREKLLDIAAGTFPYPVDGSGKKTRSTYSLADICKTRLGVVVSKGADTWRTRYGELYDTPIAMWPKDAVDYAIKDAELTLLMHRNQETRRLEIDYEIPTQFADARGDFALRLMSAWGVLVDTERAEALWEGTVGRMKELAEVLEGVGLVVRKKKSLDLFESGRSSLPDVKKSLSAIRELIVMSYPGGDVPLTPKLAVKTSEDVIAECDCYELNVLSEFSHLQKMASTYLEKLFEPIIHARFDSVGASSNRTSCRGPNLQNQPRIEGFRECFIPPEGRVFIDCDFDSQEMRTLAQSALDICGHSKLAERFQLDRHYDPHLEFAARLGQVTVDEATALMAGKDEGIKKLRQQAKVCNFGFPGGMGPPTFVQFAKGWGVTIEEGRARVLKKAFMDQWPEMWTYFRHVSNIVGEAGEGTMIHPQSGFRRGDCPYTEIANGYFQTLAAHASKAALFEVSRRCYNVQASYLYGSRPVLFVHDEIVAETPEEAGHEAAQEMEAVMVEQMEDWTPNVPSAASAKLMRCWSKQAEQVFDAKGRMIPWDESHT